MVTIRVERDLISAEMAGGYEYDPKGVAVDDQGHEHRMVDKAYPTLEWRPKMVYCSDCRDEHDEGWFECRECGQPVKPRVVWKGPRTEHVPGLIRYFVDDREVSAEEARKLIETSVSP